MDRVIVYVGENPLDTDFLNAQKNAMIGMGMLAQAVLGTSTLIDGLACTPTAPASLQVLLAPGSIYSQQNVDNTAYGSLAANTTNQIMKQGILLGTTTLPTSSTYFAAPSTTGYSINYLIEATYEDVDTGATTLPYYNASNPSVAYNGPGGNGTSQNTLRQGQLVIAIKTGTAATTGSQSTPSPDAGYVGLWVVTVANGQSTITSGNISAYSGAPFIANKLPSMLVAANTPLAGTVRNGKMSVTSASATASFTADEVIVETSLGGLPYKLASYSQSVNLGTTGAGGMDTGSAPSSGYVALYAIYGSAGTSILATNATSAAAPTIYGGSNMPSGYTASALISVWPTNSSSQFVPGIQRDRKVTISPISVLSTSSPPSSYTSLSISGAVPMNAVTVYGYVSISTAGAGSANSYVAANGNGVGAQWVGIVASGQSALSVNYELQLQTAQTVYYNDTISGTTGAMTIGVTGYAF